jgi:hypothetical protein
MEDTRYGRSVTEVCSPVAEDRPQGKRSPIRVRLSQLVTRRELFQTRDTDAGSAVTANRVNELRRNFDVDKLTPLEVVKDPWQPDCYIITAGHHRSAAAADQLASDAEVDAWLTDGDIRDPQFLDQRQKAAAASNFSSAEMNTRETIRTIAVLREGGSNPDEIAGDLRISVGEVERLQDIERVGAQAIDRAVTDPASIPVAAEVGRGVRLYDLSSENADALFRRFTQPDEQGKLISRSALRRIIRRFAPKVRGLSLPGLEEMAGGTRGGILSLIDEQAREQATLERERHLLEGQIKGTAELGERTGLTAEAGALLAAGQQALADVEEKKEIHDRDLERQIRVLAEPVGARNPQQCDRQTDEVTRSTTKSLACPAPDSLLASTDGGLAGNESWEPLPITDCGQDPEINWIWGEGRKGFLAKGMLTDFYGLWKSGKTTLLANVLAKRGDALLGLPVKAGRTLMISEEPVTSWGRRARRFGLAPEGTGLIARPFKRKPSWDDWQRLVDHVAALVRDQGYDLVVWDALPNLWPVLRENEAGEAIAALQSLLAIAEEGAAVLVVRHPRKGGGGEATAGRGSGAIDGFVDIIVEFRRYRPERKNDTHRVLTVYSREEPFELVVDWSPDEGYTALGTQADVGREEQRRQVEQLLPSQEPGLTAEELLDSWEIKPKPGERRLRELLAELVEEGRMERCGAGVKGDPYRYWQLNSIPAGSAPIAANTNGREQAVLGLLVAHSAA